MAETLSSSLAKGFRPVRILVPQPQDCIGAARPPAASVDTPILRAELMADIVHSFERDYAVFDLTQVNAGALSSLLSDGNNSRRSARVTPTSAAYSETVIASPAPQARHAMSDLVERLRLIPSLQPMSLHAQEVTALAYEAAAEIERLRGGKPLEIEHAETASIDWQRQEIIRGGTPVPLTGCEWLIFARLVKSAGRVVTRGELLDAIYWWDPSGGAGPKIIDVYVCRLRKKSPWPISTAWGRGYRIDGCHCERPPIPLPRVVAGVTRERLMAGR